MKIQSEISIYPLKTDSLSSPIYEFCQMLKQNGLEVDTQTMGSIIIGESDTVFESVRKAFGKLAEKYDLVMDFKVSNACPE